MEKNYYLLQDTDNGEVDAIIISDKSISEVQEIVTEVRAKVDYQWDDFLNAMPDGTVVIDCFKKNRVYY